MALHDASTDRGYAGRSPAATAPDLPGPAERILSGARHHLTRPVTWVAMGVAALACGVAGPFGTGDILPVGPRILFWSVMVAVTYSGGTLASEVAWELVGRRRPGWQGRMAGALGPALVTPPQVLALNTAMLGTPYPFDGLAGFVASLALTGGLVGLLVDLAVSRPFGRRVDRDGGRHGPAPAGPAPVVTATGVPVRLLARLPPDLRAPLVALSGRGHYVRVRTRAGEVELLMRMADAVAETAGVAGLRVHRSHWVATTEVRAVRRRGPGAVLTMSAGPDVPVSRAGLRDLRAAGLWADGDREPVGLRGRADG